jgi:hypothetical protein
MNKADVLVIARQQLSDAISNIQRHDRRLNSVTAPGWGRTNTATIPR